jgi:hypothetical protein
VWQSQSESTAITIDSISGQAATWIGHVSFNPSFSTLQRLVFRFSDNSLTITCPDSVIGVAFRVFSISVFCSYGFVARFCHGFQNRLVFSESESTEDCQGRRLLDRDELAANQLVSLVAGVRLILGLCGGSHSGSIRQIQIGASVDRVAPGEFSGFAALSEVLFPSDCRLKYIGGFERCRSLRRIEFPSSVEIISIDAFYRCSSLTEVLFAFDCCLREIGGFRKCTALCQIDIPSSVDVISVES